jgi:hypothetical protein
VQGLMLARGKPLKDRMAGCQPASASSSEPAPSESDALISRGRNWTSLRQSHTVQDKMMRRKCVQVTQREGRSVDAAREQKLECGCYHMQRGRVLFQLKGGRLGRVGARQHRARMHQTLNALCNPYHSSITPSILAALWCTLQCTCGTSMR